MEQWVHLKPKQPRPTGPQLRVFNPYHGVLNIHAHRLLGSPPAVHLDLEPTSGRYSLSPAQYADPSALRLGRGRRLALGVLASALREASFPLVISLQLERSDGATPRLLFRQIESVTRG